MRISDWSSDVCSSDLREKHLADQQAAGDALLSGRGLPGGVRAAAGGDGAVADRDARSGLSPHFRPLDRPVPHVRRQGAEAVRRREFLAGAAALFACSPTQPSAAQVGGTAGLAAHEVGRESGRERMGQYVEIVGVAGTVTTTNNKRS